MILFELQCEHGDRFEAWFRSSADYDVQAAEKRIDCPACGSANVAKAIMAPAVAARTRNAPPAIAAEPATPSPAAPSQPVAAGGPDLAKAMQLMQQIAREVRAKSDYVGPRFAEEARKIHYEEAPARSIYGEASTTEMKELAEEGVGFHPLPPLPEDRN
ncbi:MAG: DUF1178 family protein [Bauldia sp.]|nr:DUF1178 family protein [Bauldia sp.]